MLIGRGRGRHRPARLIAVCHRLGAVAGVRSRTLDHVLIWRRQTEWVPARVSREEEFRAQAAECDKLAEHTTDPEAKQMFLQAAEN
jgi:hypothetical protein